MCSDLYRRWWLNAALVALLTGVSLGFDVPPEIEYPLTPAEASRIYFQRVSQTIDQLVRQTERCFSSKTPAMSVLCLHRAGRDINEVPTVYVDRDLVQWTTQIRCQLSEAAKQCKLARREMVSRLTSRQAAHEKVTDAECSALRKEADDRIRQVIDSMLKNVQQMQSDARSKMTHKYQVQF